MKPHELLKSLINWGWTQSRIAEEIGVSQVMVSHLSRQKRKHTGYDVGVKLVALHAKEKKKQSKASND